MKHWRVVIGLCGGLLLVGGCGRKSSLLMERPARGPLSGEPEIALATSWNLTPETSTQTQGAIEVTATWASARYLQTFFSHKEVFGKYAGINPYFPEQMVFYLKMINRSGKRLLADPSSFVLVDDRGNQYRNLSVDYTTTLAETKTPVTTVTRGLLKDARPGYFGFSVPVGQMFVGDKPSRRFALLTMATFQPGYLYDGVSYDGLIAFWSPHQEARALKLVVGDLKTDFTAASEARTSLDFVFDWTAAPSTATSP